MKDSLVLSFRMNSIPFPNPMRVPKENRIAVPGLGKVRFHKQEIPIERPFGSIALTV